MRPDPEPDIGRTIKSGQYAMIESHSRGPQPWFDFLEVQGWMPWVEVPEGEILSGKLLNSLRQLLIAFHEPLAGAAVHGAGGSRLDGAPPALPQ